jgi:hypothetical protein
MKNIWSSVSYQSNNQKIMRIKVIGFDEAKVRRNCIQHKGKNTVFDTVFLRYFQFFL